MITKENAGITKGMIFAGCSYTWGQGLYYYSNLSTLQDQSNPWGYHNIYTQSHQRFKESVRYPRLVAKHFNSFEFVHPENGGANDGIIEYWENCFTNRSEGATIKNLANGTNDVPIYKIKYTEVSHLIFQLTQWNRDIFRCKVDGEIIEAPMQWYWDINPNRDKPYADLLEKYMNTNKLEFGSMNNDLIVGGLNNVKRFLSDCESKGIKTYVLAWPHEFISRIEKDDWLKQRWITFDYNNINYKCIEHMNLANPELEIYKDYTSFKVPPQDSHPSLKCHEIIADNIIKYIENQNNLWQIY